MTKWGSLIGGLGLGVLVGTLSGLLGIGGGILMVPALYYIWQQEMHQEMQMAVGTSLAVMIPTALVGACRHHFSYGNVHWELAGVLAVGAIAGTYFIGAPLAETLPSDALRKIFGVLMVLVGLHMLGITGYLSALVK